jgi:hypothetical protein
MEGSHGLGVFVRRGIPVLMVRAILDPFDMDLIDPTPLLNDSGAPRLVPLMAHLAVHPNHLGSFYDLMRRAKACGRALDQFTERYLELYSG